MYIYVRVCTYLTNLCVCIYICTVLHIAVCMNKYKRACVLVLQRLGKLLQRLTRAEPTSDQRGIPNLGPVLARSSLATEV